MGAPRWGRRFRLPTPDAREVGRRKRLPHRALHKAEPYATSFEYLAQGFRGVTFLMAGPLFGGAGDHDAAAVLAAIGPQVDDPIRGLHYIQIMLDYHHRVAQVHQALQNVEQFADIVEVQAGGRLIEQVKGAAGLALAEFLGQLDTLRLAAGERGGGLSEVDVAQAHVVQRLQLDADLRQVFHQRQGVLDGGFQQIGDGVALELHLQGFAIVASPAAQIARHVDVRQEVHLDALEPVALARLAAAALHVEAEASRLVAALARFGQHGVQVADGGEEAGVGGGVGARRTADGALVDADHLVQQLDALDAIVSAGLFVRAVNFLGQRAVEDFIDQGGFPAARNAGDHGEQAERDFGIHLFQIVLARSVDDQLLAVALTARGGYGNAPRAGEILSGERCRVALDFGGGAASHQLPAPAPPPPAALA